jgi:hypothetical protein
VSIITLEAVLEDGKGTIVSKTGKTHIEKKLGVLFI